MYAQQTQICLGIRPVWSEFLLCAQWVAKDPSFLYVGSEDWSAWANDKITQKNYTWQIFCHYYKADNFWVSTWMQIPTFKSQPFSERV